MAVWKHYIILFGGFYDPGITSQLLTFEADELCSKKSVSAISERLMGIRHAGIQMDARRV